MRKETAGRKRIASFRHLRLRVAPVAGARTRGKLVVGPRVIPCALGRNGVNGRKREGDGATPAGCFALLGVHVRADRSIPPRTLLPRRATRPDDGWCDDPRHARYNRRVRLPFEGAHERLWRADRLYDLVVVIDYNIRHPLKGRGSAIFLHVAEFDLRPTAGCVALRPADLRRLLPCLSRRTRLAIGP